MESKPHRQTILVTGGAGAIGIHVVGDLRNQHDVVVYDNLSSGRLAYLNEFGVKTYVADIRDNEKLEMVFEKHKIDTVVHLAAHFANQNSVDFPSSDLAVNAAGTLNLLKLCARYKSRFVYASSSCVYGQKAGSLTENLAIDDLHTPYAISKYTGELYTQFFAHHHNVPAIALRFFNSFGPGEGPGPYRNVIPNFISRALSDQPLIITGTGEETRDFNYVGNTAQAVALSINALAEQNSHFEVFNVGTGMETRIDHLAQSILDITGGKGGVEIQGQRRDWDQTVTRKADITSIGSRLGYRPETTIADGLKYTVDWFRTHPDLWH